ncbi:hypothetical protein KC19_7G028000 [Ceratodon purpureus]|uniref:Serine protease n=1 Tax=Ceratodon purpureus TaxID=3225 RepID=A0A8T0HA32_CERPU|nr:hypothetical protein KC19_7G028000 [Ceratodon purpureus]
MAACDCGHGQQLAGAKTGPVYVNINIQNMVMVSDEGWVSNVICQTCDILKQCQTLTGAGQHNDQFPRFGSSGASSVSTQSSKPLVVSRTRREILGSPLPDVNPKQVKPHDFQLTVSVDALSKSVVHIEVTTRKGIATGTGSIYDAEQKLVITNKHVADGDNLTVTVWGVRPGQITRYKASVFAWSSTQDLALLKLIDCYEELSAVRLGSSKSLQLMQQVFTIGYPLHVGMTVTSGRVSAFRDYPTTTGPITSVNGAIQLDANINPGNSGGPVYNMDGEVIAVVFCRKESDSGSGSGIACAIPIDTVKQWVNLQLAEGVPSISKYFKQKPIALSQDSNLRVLGVPRISTQNDHLQLPLLSKPHVLHSPQVSVRSTFKPTVRSISTLFPASKQCTSISGHHK